MYVHVRMRIRSQSGSVRQLRDRTTRSFRCFHLPALVFTFFNKTINAGYVRADIITESRKNMRLQNEPRDRRRLVFPTIIRRTRQDYSVGSNTRGTRTETYLLPTAGLKATGDYCQLATRELVDRRNIRLSFTAVGSSSTFTPKVFHALAANVEETIVEFG